MRLTLMKRMRARWRLWWRFKRNNNTVIHDELTPEEKEEMKRMGFMSEIPKELADSFVQAVKDGSLDWVSPVRTIEFDAELPSKLIKKMDREFEEWHKRTGGTIFEWMDEKREQRNPDQSE